MINSLNEIWNSVINHLSTQLTPTAVTTWFSESAPVEIDGNRFVIQTTGDFKRQIITNRFKDIIEGILSEIFSSQFELMVITADELAEYNAEKESMIESSSMPAELAGYTFDNFIVGECNRFAHAAAVNVSENPGRLYNPLFIHGNSGLGKTHLLLAIGHAIFAKDNSKKIIYIKGDDFTNKMVKSIKEGTTEQFRNEFRKADLLLMDDIQFIAGKQSTQNEFFHTFNTLYESGKTIVITSDRPPSEMSVLDDRLRTRFEGGLMVDIAPPDYETRMVIAKTKASQLGLILGNESVEMIANSIKSNIRQLEGVIKRLTAYKEILGQEITPEYIKKAIEAVSNEGIYTPTPKKIIRETARYFSIKEEDIRGQSKQKNIAKARQIAMYLMRMLTSDPLVEIGREFENRHHSTVLNSIKKVEELLKADPSTSSLIRDITSNINSSTEND